MAAEIERVLVFRTGSFEADYALGEVRTLRCGGIAAADSANTRQSCQALGKGGNGQCRKAQRRNVRDAPQLCVKMPLSVTSDMQNEVDLMRNLGDCEYIVRFVAYYRVGEGASLQQHIVMEARAWLPALNLPTNGADAPPS